VPRASHKPTSHDIAREVGVSQSTVSRALRRDPRVDPMTAERVIDAARRLGYTPNASARSLVTTRTRTVAVAVSDITNPFYPQLVETLHEQLGRHGYRMVLFNERTDPRGDDALDRFLTGGGADGAVFLSVTMDRAVSDMLDAMPVPIVLLNRDAPAATVDRVLADHLGGAEQVAEHLVELGHRALGFIAGPANTSTSHDREAGLTAVLGRHGLELDPRRVRRGEFSYQAGFQGATELLSRGPRPTAIFCANDVIAFGALDAARRLRIGVPCEVSIAGFDDIAMAGWDAFSLTTVRQPLLEMARDAARLLIGRIEGDHTGEPAHLVFPTHLIRRSTTSAAA
jgi:LacI family transcriptional regulator